MLLERLFGATLENPQFSLNDQMAMDLFGGPANDAGVRVNSSTANTYSPWFRGLNIVSRDVARLPFYPFQRLPDEDDADNVRGKRPYREHPSYPVTLRKANQFQTAFHLKLQLTAHAMSRGNGYGYIVRAGDGSVLPVSEGGGIWPLDPNNTTPTRMTVSDVSGPIEKLVSSRLLYVVVVNGQPKKIDSEDVLHIKGMGFDGLVGYDVVNLASNTIGRGMAQAKFANTFYKNGAHLKVVLETPGVLTESQAREIIRSWDSAQGGLDNAHRTAILHRGLKANALSSSARDSQFIEGEEFNIRFVANFLGIPAHKLGAKTGESYASKEQENLDYLLSALAFWLKAWQDECWDKLLTEKEKADDSVDFEFDVSELYKADSKTMAEYWRIALAGQPWAKVNEARSHFNMNPVDDGNEIKSPLNMGGVDNEPKQPGSPTPKKTVPMEEEDTDEQADAIRNAALRGAIKANLEDAVRRVVRRIGNAAEKAAKTPATFCDWLEAVPDDHGKIVSEMLTPACSAATALTSKDYDPKIQIDASCVLTEICEALNDFAGRVTPKTMAAELPKELARLEAEVPGKVSALFFGE